jgi:hypothetical protein
MKHDVVRLAIYAAICQAAYSTLVAQIAACEPGLISRGWQDEAPRGDEPLGAKIIRTLALL